MKRLRFAFAILLATTTMYKVNAQKNLKMQAEKTDVYACHLECNNDKTYNKPGKCLVSGMKLK
jgi:hypothetical protein